MGLTSAPARERSKCMPPAPQKSILTLMEESSVLHSHGGATKGPKPCLSTSNRGSIHYPGGSYYLCRPRITNSIKSGPSQRDPHTIGVTFTGTIYQLRQCKTTSYANGLSINTKASYSDESRLSERTSPALSRWKSSPTEALRSFGHLPTPTGETTQLRTSGTLLYGHYPITPLILSMTLLGSLGSIHETF